MKSKKTISAAMIMLMLLTACGAESAGKTDDAEEKISETTVINIQETETESVETAAEENAAEEDITSEDTSAIQETESASETEESTADSISEETEKAELNEDPEEETQAELSEGQSLVKKDLNGDGRDEEIFSYNPFGLCDITYYDSADKKQTVSFDVMSVWGGTWYLNGTKQILNLKFYAHSDGTGTGFEMDLYDFSGADIKLLHTYSADGGYVLENGGTPSEMTYTIDGKEYSASDFISEASALSELCEKELGYSLFMKDSRNENNYIINSELPNSCGCNMLS